jgi:quercetin dioxygenase-like cupin family protein
MATQEFETQQLLRAYRKGLISDELFEKQMQEVNGNGQNGGNTLDVANVFEHKDTSFKMFQNTPQSQTAVFTLPPGYTNDEASVHKGDQILYVVDGCAVANVSGMEHEIKAGDVVMIPAGSPHTLRTGEDSFFGFTVFTPPELDMDMSN